MNDDFAMNAFGYQGSISGEYEDSTRGESGFTAIRRAEGSEPTMILGKASVDAACPDQPAPFGVSIERSWRATVDSIIIGILEDFLTRERPAAPSAQAPSAQDPAPLPDVPTCAPSGILML